MHAPPNVFYFAFQHFFDRLYWRFRFGVLQNLILKPKHAIKNELASIVFRPSVCPHEDMTVLISFAKPAGQQNSNDVKIFPFEYIRRHV